MAAAKDAYIDAQHYPRIVSRQTRDGVQTETLEYDTEAAAHECASSYRDRGCLVFDVAPSANGYTCEVQIDGTQK